MWWWWWAQCELSLGPYRYYTRTTFVCVLQFILSSRKRNASEEGVRHQNRYLVPVLKKIVANIGNPRDPNTLHYKTLTPPLNPTLSAALCCSGGRWMEATIYRQCMTVVIAKSHFVPQHPPRERPRLHLLQESGRGRNPAARGTRGRPSGSERSSRAQLALGERERHESGAGPSARGQPTASSRWSQGGRQPRERT